MPLQPRMLLRQLMELRRTVRESTAAIPVADRAPAAVDAATKAAAAMDAATKAAAAIDAATNSSESLAALASAPASATAFVEAATAAKSADKSAATDVVTTAIPAAMDVAIAVPRTSDEVRRSRADADVLGMSASSLYVHARHLPSQMAPSCFDLPAAITTAVHANFPPSEANAIGVSTVYLSGGLRFGFWLSSLGTINRELMKQLSWDIAATSSWTSWPLSLYSPSRSKVALF